MARSLPRRAWSSTRWWARWWVRYFPGHLVRRLRRCRHGHAGPLYDGLACLTCGAPWFRSSL